MVTRHSAEGAISDTRQGYRVGEILVDPEANKITRGDQTFSLQAQLMNVLVHLLEAAPRVVSASELLDSLWPGRVVEDSLIHRRISQIRQAMGDDPRDSIEPILSVQAVGIASEFWIATCRQTPEVSI